MTKVYRPPVVAMTTVIRIKTRTKTTVNGAAKTSYADAATAPVDSCEWKGMGGTDTGEVAAGVRVYDDTADVTMYYRDDIRIHDQLLLNDDTDLVYEIISPPENVNMRCQFLKFKVAKVGGA
jgi:hypothetical protein